VCARDFSSRPGFRFKDRSAGELAGPYILFRSMSHRSTLWGRRLGNKIKGLRPLDLHEFWYRSRRCGVVSVKKMSRGYWGMICDQSRQWD
jgi:hypothetical protein